MKIFSHRSQNSSKETLSSLNLTRWLASQTIPAPSCPQKTHFYEGDNDVSDLPFTEILFFNLSVKFQGQLSRCWLCYLHYVKTETRANCSRKVREIESGSWKRWLGWRGWQMIICKRPVPPDDHLQEDRSSGWSFARGRTLWMIICKPPVPTDDHLHLAGSSRWSFERGRILRIIICKWPDPPDVHLQEAEFSGWIFSRSS